MWNRAEPRVKFLDLSWQTRQIRTELKSGWRDVVGRGEFVLSTHVEEFEEAFALFSGVRFAVGVGNGTDALEIAMRSLEIGHGDEVILPANSFVASAVAVSRTGASPVLVDCEPGTWLIDTSLVEKSITARTKAIMPVHLYGQMADMAEIERISSRFGIPIIEDVAQAHGASQNGNRAGSFGQASATSFYPGKNLGAMGDGGAVLTSSERVMERSRALRNYGSTRKYMHPEFGFNSRLDSMQAVALSAKLKRLNSWNEMRRAQSAYYFSALRDVENLGLPVLRAGNEHVWHLFVVNVDSRGRVVEEMANGGIETGIHYPRPIHLHGMYKHLGHQEGDFPVSELASRTCLSLPIYPGLTQKKQKLVVESLKRALDGTSRGQPSPRTS